jgi:hypothetical protein
MALLLKRERPQLPAPATVLHWRVGQPPGPPKQPGVSGMRRQAEAPTQRQLQLR